jgi:hypothetical protein
VWGAASVVECGRISWAKMVECGRITWAKWKILVQILISLFLKSHGGSYGEFSEAGFPHNFTQNDRHDLKLGCIDASRRQLRYVLKIGA